MDHSCTNGDLLNTPPREGASVAAEINRAFSPTSSMATIRIEWPTKKPVIAR